MAKIAKKKLMDALTKNLHLVDPEFDLESLSSGRLSGSVISDTFKGKDDSTRQQAMWDALESEFGPASAQYVGTLLAYTKAEWSF